MVYKKKSYFTSICMTTNQLTNKQQIKKPRMETHDVWEHYHNWTSEFNRLMCVMGGKKKTLKGCCKEEIKLIIWSMRKCNE